MAQHELPEVQQELLPVAQHDLLPVAQHLGWLAASHHVVHVWPGPWAVLPLLLLVLKALCELLSCALSPFGIWA